MRIEAGVIFVGTIKALRKVSGQEFRIQPESFKIR